MFLVAINKPRQLLYFSFIGRVSVEELERRDAELAKLLEELTTGFRLLARLTPLDRFGPDCAGEIGKAMDLCDQKGVGLVVRIIPDPTKDIGLNILSVFHYSRRPRFVTCKSLLEAAEIVRLGDHAIPL